MVDLFELLIGREGEKDYKKNYSKRFHSDRKKIQTINGNVLIV